MKCEASEGDIWKAATTGRFDQINQKLLFVLCMNTFSKKVKSDSFTPDAIDLSSTQSST